jgi:hypothetical protein
VPDAAVSFAPAPSPAKRSILFLVKSVARWAEGLAWKSASDLSIVPLFGGSRRTVFSEWFGRAGARELAGRREGAGNVWPCPRADGSSGLTSYRRLDHRSRGYGALDVWGTRDQIGQCAGDLLIGLGSVPDLDGKPRPELKGACIELQP